MKKIIVDKKEDKKITTKISKRKKIIELPENQSYLFSEAAFELYKSFESCQDIRARYFIATMPKENIMCFMEYAITHKIAVNDNFAFLLDIMSNNKRPESRYFIPSKKDMDTLNEKRKANKHKKRDSAVTRARYEFSNSNQNTQQCNCDKVRVYRDFLDKLIEDIIKEKKIRNIGDSLLFCYLMLNKEASLGSKNQYSVSMNGKAQFFKSAVERGQIFITDRECGYKEKGIKFNSVGELFHTSTEKGLKILKDLENRGLCIIKHSYKGSYQDTIFVVAVSEYVNKGKGHGFKNNGYFFVKREMIELAMSGEKPSELDCYLDMLLNTVSVDPSIAASNFIPIYAPCYNTNSCFVKYSYLTMRWGISSAGVAARLSKWIRKRMISTYTPVNGKNGIVISPAGYCTYFLRVYEPVMPSEKLFSRMLELCMEKKISFNIRTRRVTGEEYSLEYNKLEQYASKNVLDKKEGYRRMIYDNRVPSFNDIRNLNVGDLFQKAISGCSEKNYFAPEGPCTVKCKWMPDTRNFQISIYSDSNEYKENPSLDFIPLVDTQNNIHISIRSNIPGLNISSVSYAPIESALDNYYRTQYINTSPEENMYSIRSDIYVFEHIPRCYTTEYIFWDLIA